jgi:hypothetical protein
MKRIFQLGLLIVIFSSAIYAESNFVVIIKDGFKLNTAPNKSIELKIGDMFPLSEEQNIASDRVNLLVGKNSYEINKEFIANVKEADVSTAALKYSDWLKQQESVSEPLKGAITLSRTERRKMLYKIRQAKLITSINDAEKVYSDEQIVELHKKAIDMQLKKKELDIQRQLNNEVRSLNETLQGY